jgi:hypothetical protein
MKHDYQKALRAWMGVGHGGGDPDDIHAIHSALTIAAKLRAVGVQYKFYCQLTGIPVWRDRIDPWNGQEPSDTRQIFVIDEIPIEAEQSDTIGKEILEDFYKTGGTIG